MGNQCQSGASALSNGTRRAFSWPHVSGKQCGPGYGRRTSPKTPLPANSGLPISSTNASPIADMTLSGNIRAGNHPRRQRGIAALGWKSPPAAL